MSRTCRGWGILGLANGVNLGRKEVEFSFKCWALWGWTRLVQSKWCSTSPSGLLFYRVAVRDFQWHCRMLMQIVRLKSNSSVCLIVLQLNNPSHARLMQLSFIEISIEKAILQKDNLSKRSEALGQHRECPTIHHFGSFDPNEKNGKDMYSWTVTPPPAICHLSPPGQVGVWNCSLPSTEK